nr:hypothetical protein BaRGS_011561 [Batillaria attramentaria]
MAVVEVVSRKIPAAGESCVILPSFWEEREARPDWKNLFGLLPVVVVVTGAASVEVTVPACALENFNVVIFSESTNSRGTKLGMLID